MKYVLYPGCLMQTEQYGYELSVREVLPKLGVEFVEVNGFSCCGSPLKSVNQLMTLYLSARNLALVEKQGCDVYAPCAECHVSLSLCKHTLDNNEEMKKRINGLLAEEELVYTGSSEVVHTVDLLYDKIGLDAIAEHVKKPLKDIKVAAHPGCYVVRPSEIGRPDDSENPQKMDKILKVLGAKPSEYPEKLDCCGAPLLVNLPESALTKTGQKLQRIQEQAFDAVTTVCPWCHKMFDARQQKAGETVAAKLEVPVLYLTQLVGLAMGLDASKLGVQLNLSPVEKLKEVA